MNTYTWDQLDVGQEVRFEATLTPDMLQAFAALSGDKNPLHCDPDYAKAAGFPDTVAYGMLVSSFYSTLAGMYLPGLNSLLLSVHTKFHSPAFPGDCLCISGKITGKVEALQVLEVKAVIRNQREEKVSSATLQIKVRGD